MGVLHESPLQSIPVLFTCLTCILDVGFNFCPMVEENGHMGVDDIHTKEQEQHLRQWAFVLYILQAL